MSTATDTTMQPTRRAPRSSRIARELRAACELWLLPALVALLPYRAGILLARALAATLPLYRQAAEAGAAQCRAKLDTDERRWQTGYRFSQLVDHADLFWSLTRPRDAMLARLRMPALTLPPGPLLVVSFHYGQGLWLLHWLNAGGRATRFVSIRLSREHADSTLGYAYARLRNRQVERLSGAKPIYTGGARSQIASALAGGGTVYGLIDVPLAPSARRANCTLLDTPASLPTGLLECAAQANVPQLVLTAAVGSDGSRTVEACVIAPETPSPLAAVAGELDARLRRVPHAWHFWHLWPSFQAVPAGRS